MSKITKPNWRIAPTPTTLAEALVIINEQHALLGAAENALTVYADPSFWKEAYAGNTAKRVGHNIRKHLRVQKKPRPSNAEAIAQWWLAWNNLIFKI